MIWTNLLFGSGLVVAGLVIGIMKDDPVMGIATVAMGGVFISWADIARLERKIERIKDSDKSERTEGE